MHPLLLATALAARTLAASPGAPDVAPDTAARITCDGRVVSAIDVHAGLPPLGGVFRRSRLLAETVRSLHVTTREQVIRRFLALREGQACSELRRSESERILRAQPFLADARIETFDDGAGGVRVDVTTYDELALVVAMAARSQGTAVSALRAGNANLMGEGIYLSGEWRDGAFYRDRYALRFTDYQLLGRPYQLTLEGARQPFGGDWLGAVSHPYFTDLQRVAWQGAAGAVRDYARFVRPGGHGGALRVDRSFADAGGLARIGAPGRLSLVGGSVSRETEATDADPVFVTDSGIVDVADPTVGGVLAGRYGAHRATRVNALVGVRNVRFERVAAFDALRAEQDVRIGVQLGALVGRSLRALGSDDDDFFVAADFYAARGTPRNFVALQGRGEGRQDGTTTAWDGVLTSGRGAWYARPAPWNTLVTSAEWAAGWRQRVPFQLTLSDLEGGLRGYRRSELAGSQRAVLRVEDRTSFGTVKQLADVGLAAFVDAGRLWAGDAPYGVDTRPKLGAGVGLLAAVPPGSKRLWRVDLAFPLNGDPASRWELRVSSHDRTRAFYRDPDDVRQARERTIPASIFSWP